MKKLMNILSAVGIIIFPLLFSLLIGAGVTFLIVAVTFAFSFIPHGAFGEAILGLLLYGSPIVGLWVAFALARAILK